MYIIMFVPDVCVTAARHGPGRQPRAAAAARAPCAHAAARPAPARA